MCYLSRFSSLLCDKNVFSCTDMIILYWLNMEFLGQLPKVDLIILEGENVRPYVRPSTKTFLDFNEIWYIGRGR